MLALSVRQETDAILRSLLIEQMTNKAMQAVIGQRLRALRMEIGLSQQAIATEVNLTRQAVAQWETGATSISAVHIALLAAIYGTSTDYLIVGLRTARFNFTAGRDQGSEFLQRIWPVR